jgi:hypothetical protein
MGLSIVSQYEYPYLRRNSTWFRADMCELSGRGHGLRHGGNQGVLQTPSRRLAVPSSCLPRLVLTLCPHRPAKCPGRQQGAPVLLEGVEPEHVAPVHGLGAIVQVRADQHGVKQVVGLGRCERRGMEGETGVSMAGGLGGQAVPSVGGLLQTPLHSLAAPGIAQQAVAPRWTKPSCRNGPCSACLTTTITCQTCAHLLYAGLHPLCHALDCLSIPGGAWAAQKPSAEEMQML